MGGKWYLISDLTKSKCDCKPQCPRDNVQTPVVALKLVILVGSLHLAWSERVEFQGVGWAFSYQHGKQKEGLEGN